MKHLLLILLCLFASTARADDISALTWNPVSNNFSAVLKTLPPKIVPDQQVFTATSVPSVASGGGSCSGCTWQYTLVKTGRVFTFNGLLSTGTITGTANSFSLALPGNILSTTYCNTFSDATTNVIGQTFMSPGANLIRFGTYTSSTMAAVAFVSSASWSTTVTCISAN